MLLVYSTIPSGFSMGFWHFSGTTFFMAKFYGRLSFIRNVLGASKLPFKADMKSYIPLETAAIFILANLFPKQGISSENVTADFICMSLLGLQGAKTENYKMKNSCPYRDSNLRPLILKYSALSMRLSSLIYKR